MKASKLSAICITLIGLQLLAAVGRAGQVGLDIPGGCPVCVQLAPVGFLEFLLLLLPADGGILLVDRLVLLIVLNVGDNINLQSEENRLKIN